jgi:hypothetical protein
MATDEQTTEAQVVRLLREIMAQPPTVQALLLERLLGRRAHGITPATAREMVATALATTPSEPRPRPSADRSRVERPEAALESPFADMGDRFDPLEAWERYPDAERLLAALQREPVGVLEAMLRHPRMPGGKPPRGKTATALARCIVQRVAAADR